MKIKITGTYTATYNIPTKNVDHAFKRAKVSLHDSLSLINNKDVTRAFSEHIHEEVV